jgi:hypothetical protein
MLNTSAQTELFESKIPKLIRCFRIPYSLLIPPSHRHPAPAASLFSLHVVYLRQKGVVGSQAYLA